MTVTVDTQVAYSGDVPDASLFECWTATALASVAEDCELSIRLVDEAESTDLNSRYRGKDKPTNVLSFPFDTEIALEPRLLGDLVICVPVVEREAVEQQKLSEHHWAHIVVHGCLHLLGYDHIADDEAEEMEALEAQILATWNIANPYRVAGESSE